MQKYISLIILIVAALITFGIFFGAGLPPAGIIAVAIAAALILPILIFYGIHLHRLPAWQLRQDRLREDRHREVRRSFILSTVAAIEHVQSLHPELPTTARVTGNNRHNGGFGNISSPGLDFVFPLSTPQRSVYMGDVGGATYGYENIPATLTVKGMLEAYIIVVQEAGETLTYTSQDKKLTVEGPHMSGSGELTEPLHAPA